MIGSQAIAEGEVTDKASQKRKIELCRELGLHRAAKPETLARADDELLPLVRSVLRRRTSGPFRRTGGGRHDLTSTMPAWPLLILPRRCGEQLPPVLYWKRARSEASLL
jgi:hypothetical protein